MFNVDVDWLCMIGVQLLQIEIKVCQCFISLYRYKCCFGVWEQDIYYLYEYGYDWKVV